MSIIRNKDSKYGDNLMLRRISIQSLATILIAILLVISVAFYIFPGYKSVFSYFIYSLLIPYIILEAIAIICIAISTTKIIIRRVRKVIN